MIVRGDKPDRFANSDLRNPIFTRCSFHQFFVLEVMANNSAKKADKAIQKGIKVNK